MIACHGDRVVLGGADGVLQCLKIGPDGVAVKDWTAGGNDNRGQFNLSAGSGYLVCVNPAMRLARCYDIRSGKLRFEARGKGQNFCDAALTDDGVLVTLNGNTLSAHDPRRNTPESLLWSVQIAGVRPILLGLSNTRIAIAPAADGAEVEFRLVATGGGRRRITIGMHFPIGADFVGDKVILSCGADPRGRRAGGNGYAGTSMPSVLLADAHAGTILWEPTPTHDGHNVPCALYAPAVGEGYLAILYKPLAARHGFRYYLLNRATGRRITDAALAAAAAAAVVRADNDVVVRHARVTPPVIVGDRILVASGEGIVLLDSRRAQ